MEVIIIFVIGAILAGVALAVRDKGHIGKRYAAYVMAHDETGKELSAEEFVVTCPCLRGGRCTWLD